MKQVGKRVISPLQAEPSGELLIRWAAFNESIATIAGSSYMPKGVFRYKSHEEANRHQEACIAAGMAKLALARNCGG
jgi:hypothetical protein